MNFRSLIITLLVILCLSSKGRADVPYPDRTDSIYPDIPATIHINIPDSMDMMTPMQKHPNNDWWYLLKHRQLNLADTTVHYPRFIGFCVKVYNWADKFFNSYDPEYVVGTGHRWKARLVSDNWIDSYSMRFRDKMKVRMLGDPYSNLGAYLHYMAVSVGYSVDLNTVISGKSIDHSKFETNFNCARFNVDVNLNVNRGGTYVRWLNGYKNNKLFKTYFPGVNLTSLGINLYYFLNNKKYSQGAAYNFSKIQKKSQGSWIFGLSYSYLDIGMDFSSFPAHLKPYFNISVNKLKLHYNDYSVLVGYGYNWVFHPKFLFNITIMPGIGANYCYEDSYDGSQTLLSLDVNGRMSLTYNHKRMFVSMIAKINGHWYTSKSLSLFNSILFLAGNIGVRF